MTYDIHGKCIGEVSIDFCSNCKEIWPKFSYHPETSEDFDRPFGEGTFKVFYKDGDFTECCEAEVSRLDYDTHVSWITDLNVHLGSFSSYDETCEASAVFIFEDSFDYGIVHDWFGFDANLQLARTASIVSNPQARWNNRLHEWISDLLEEFCDYDNANKESTTFRLKFNADDQTMQILWIL